MKYSLALLNSEQLVITGNLKSTPLGRFFSGKVISRMGIAGEGNEVVIPFSSVLIAEVLEK